MFSSLVQNFISTNPVLSIFATVADVAIVAYVLYKILMLIRGTRAVQLLKGIIFLLIAANVADLLQLTTIQWILDQAWAVIFVALAVIFQPELRRALEQLGRGQFFTNAVTHLGSHDVLKLIEELTACLVTCAKTKTGVLIILEGETGLNDYIETGISIDACVTQELLVNIFTPNTPLHDGATIVRGDRVVAAACFLPLSDNPYISMALGTRHRAAIGITEVSDARALIVSEETGVISMAKDGKLIRYLEEKQIKEILSSDFTSTKHSPKYFWQRRGEQ